MCVRVHVRGCTCVTLCRLSLVLSCLSLSLSSLHQTTSSSQLLLSRVLTHAHSPTHSHTLTHTPSSHSAPVNSLSQNPTASRNNINNVQIRHALSKIQVKAWHLGQNTSVLSTFYLTDNHRNSVLCKPNARQKSFIVKFAHFQGK